MDRRFVAALLFLAAWGLYTAGAIPALYGGDSGELIASSATLGVSHAPGYPLHALLGKAGITAFRAGGPAYRVALTSAAFSALTVAFFFLVLAGRLARPGFALVGAVLYAALPIVWDQAQTAEVFALNNLFAVTLLGFSRSAFQPHLNPSLKREEIKSSAGFHLPALGEGRDGVLASRHFALWAFLYGLACANHQTIVLLLPGFACLWAQPRWDGARSVRENLGALASEALTRLPLLALFGALGASIYLFLFFRAAAHPPVNFGDPHTWPRFWSVITRKEFGTLELHPAAVPFHTAEVLWQQAKACGRLSVTTIGALPLAAGLIGLWSWRHGIAAAATVPPAERPSEIVMRPYRGEAPRPLGGRTAAWLLFWLFSGPLFVLLSNLSPFNTLAQWRLERFQLLPALFLAAGCAALLQRAWARRSTWLLVLIPAGLLVEQATAAPHPWFRHDLAFRDFGRNLAASLSPGTALVIDRVIFDEPTSALLNRLVVDRERPDLRPIYRPGTLFELFYGEDVLELTRDARMGRQADREAEFWKTWRGPVAALAFVKENLPPFPMTLSGLVYRTGAPPRAADFYVRRDAARPRDYQSRLITAHYPYFAAKAAFESGDAAAARRTASAAAWIGDDMEWLRSNLGSLWSRWSVDHAGEGLERAAREFEAAVTIDPYFPAGQYGLGFVRLQQKNYLGAVGAFSQAVRLRPDWPEAHYMLGLSFNSAGRPEQARAPWERFLELDPNSSLAPAVRQALQ